MTDDLLDAFLKCTIITELAIVGVFCMFSYATPIKEGFLIWGVVLATLVVACWLFGGFAFDDSPNAVFFVTLFNGIMINFGGYLILMLLLKYYYGFRITVGGI